MSLRNLVQDYLEEQPLFRERKNKDRGIVNLLIHKYGLGYLIESGHITKDMLTTIVQEYASMDRMWRLSLKNQPRLRGSDYNDKEELEYKAQEILGYNVPHPTL